MIDRLIRWKRKLFCWWYGHDLVDSQAHITQSWLGGQPETVEMQFLCHECREWIDAPGFISKIDYERMYSARSLSPPTSQPGTSTDDLESEQERPPVDPQSTASYRHPAERGSDLQGPGRRGL